MGQQDNPGDSTDYLVPQVVSPAGTGFAVGTLFDYFGVPTGVPGLSICAFYSRAYNKIYNDWFRDENLVNSVTVDTGDGPDTYTNYVLLRRGKRHDYFTSALPFAQKGPAVELPLSGNAPITGLGILDSSPGTIAGPITVRETGGGTSSYANYWSPASNIRMDASGVDGYPTISADLSAVSAATINELRQAFQIQRLYERDARGGTRYTEIIRSHFGVISPDARLQRPEYLGGGSSAIVISPIAQTSASPVTPGPTDTEQANLSAVGTVTAHQYGFSKSFTEHGVIIGLMHVRADLNYQQGLNRMWSRSTRFDYYWPALSHIGEQSVLNKEIFAVGSANPTQDAAVFGYQERYAEYRFYPNVITGEFRSTYSAPLDVWHLAQEFSTLPALNASFIADNPPIDRVIAQPDSPHFLFDSVFQIKAARPMPVFGVPGLIDHF